MAPPPPGSPRAAPRGGTSGGATPTPCGACVVATEIGAVAMEPGGAATAPCGVAVGTGAVVVEAGAVAMGTGQAAMEPGGAAVEAGGAAGPRVLLPREVAARARLGWVSARGRVLRLGPVLRERPGDPELRPLREAAGTDVTHWFDPQSGEPLSRADPRSGLRRLLLPGAPPPEPRSDHAPPRGAPWWRDPRLEVGHVTAAPRLLRLRNALTGQEHVIQACGEQAGGLVGRALPWNAHGGGYAWRCGGAPLPLDGPPPAPAPDGSAPTLLLHFADDFREE
ncbi:cytochrome b5 domain-containing protein 1 isoform 2-T5 [Alca torda]